MGGTEIIFIFLIYLLLFGAKGIPSLAQNLGKAVRTFRDASNDIQREILSSANEIKKEATQSVKQVRDQQDAIDRNAKAVLEGKPNANKPADTPAPTPPKGPLDQPQSDGENPPT